MRYDGYVIKSTKGAWSAQDKVGFYAGRFHHDRCAAQGHTTGVCPHSPIYPCPRCTACVLRVPRRCGRRIKAFIYLSDVTEASHPTLIAPGSHTTAHYTYEHQHFLLSRFAESHVRSTATHAVHCAHAVHQGPHRECTHPRRAL